MYIYITVNKVDIREVTEINVSGIYRFIKRKVTKFGSGAKVDRSMEFLGKRIYLIITGDEE